MIKEHTSALTLISLCLLCCCSCKPGRQNTEIKVETPSVQVENTGKVQSWPVSEKTNNDFLASETDSIRYIPLETTPECLIGQINQILRSGDSLIVVDPYSSNSACVFDLQGRFCHKIGNQGNGPGEYGRVGYVHLSDDGTIYLSDRSSGRILSYTRDGKFIKDYRLKNGAPQEFVVLNDSIIAGSYAGYSPNAPYRLKWLDWEGNELNTALPYTTNRSYVAGTFLTGKQGEVYFYHPMNDTIFEVTENSIRPYLSMNFYDEEELASFMKETEGWKDKDYLKKLFRSDKITNCVQVIRCDSHWVVYSQKGKYSYLSVIDKERRDYLRADMQKKKLYIPDYPAAAWHDWLIGYINPEALDYFSEEQRKELLKALSETHGAEISLDSLKECNPIITMYHLKTK